MSNRPLRLHDRLANPREETGMKHILLALAVICGIAGAGLVAAAITAAPAGACTQNST